MKNKPNQNDSAKSSAVKKVSAASTLQFSETEPPVAVRTSQELDQALHKAELGCTPQHPIAISLHVHGHRLGIGLGLPYSFISIQRSEPTPGPSFISLGNARVDRGAVFFFHGWRRAEIPQRNLLPTSLARQILTEFFETGTHSTKIDWEAF